MRTFPYNVPVATARGAPFGRPNVGQAHDDYMKLRLRRVGLIQGYDGGGAYWGERPRGVMLFCAWSADRSVIRYLDAQSFLFAQEALRAEFPQADFL